MKLTYFIMTSEGDVIGKVYEHSIFGRTICFEEKVKMNDIVQVWKIEENGQYEKVTERLVLEFFRDMLPI